ncbi:DMT family transporter [Rhodanobacter spathiphylli]|uniref:Putative transmembrane protein n=1 Tax=Rhodanobacter spathiphylli B39 TaxID=1163407 RepID=I4W5I2_9GAMM|nr:EamA family transporter [Rhodanobacter spathiphylli]EIL94723.1 putative transmembrane protein [Rhodanobacter spathiphylli B39]
MRRFYLFGFLLLMAFDTLAQISFKVAGSQALPVQASVAWLLRVFGQPWIYGAVVGYVGAFFTWMALLKHAPIGPAFAASHLEVVSVMLLSIWLFDEHLTVARVLGAIAIIAGIVCLGLAESREQPPDDEPAPARV